MSTANSCQQIRTEKNAAFDLDKTINAVISEKKVVQEKFIEGNANDYLYHI